MDLYFHCEPSNNPEDMQDENRGTDHAMSWTPDEMPKNARFDIEFALEVLCLLVIFCSQFFAGKTLFNGGLGGDGVRYAGLLQNLEVALTGPHTRAIDFERVFPIGLAWLLIQMRGLATSTENIIEAFDWVAILAMLTAYGFFHLICRDLKLNIEQRWLCFAFCFVSFPVAKFAGFNPVLTDIWAFTLGLGALLFYLRQEPWLLALVTLLAGFSWPPGYLFGLILLFFPRDSKLVFGPKLSRWLLITTSCFLVLGLVSVFYYLQITNTIQVPDTTPVATRWLWLSLAVCIGFALWTVKNSFAAISGEKTEILWPLKQLAMGGALAAGPIAFRAFAMQAFTRPGSLGNGGRPLAKTLLLFFKLSLVAPGHFLVAHYFYWGLGFLLLLFFKLRCTLQLAAKFGFGLYLICVISVILLLDSESRHALFVLPIMFILMIVSMKNWEIRWRDLVLVTVAQILVSKIYLIESIKGEPDSVWGEDELISALSLGPWMPRGVYSLGLALMLATLIVIWVYRHARPASPRQVML